MSLNKFKKLERKPFANPVDTFNENPNFEYIFQHNKTYEWINEEKKLHYMKKEVAYFDGEHLHVTESCELDEPMYTPFQLLVMIRFGSDYRKAIQWIEFKYMNAEVPYIRVGVNYFKRIEKKNRYGVTLNELKVWNKESICQDHGNEILKAIHLFDDFTIEPNNKDYQPIVSGYWNLYEPFPHKMHDMPVSVSDFPTTAHFMAHVFGDQVELGYKYMKVLYEFPRQILPVLTLVSKERMTGKTTFLNWIDMIFGNNYAMVSPDDLLNSFNSAYATKNIIGIDEAVIEKSSGVEKIKSIATANTLTVNQKMVSHYRVPFFGKIIITTNRESDFMKVDSEEIRFWVRKLNSIPQDKMTTNYEGRLLEEIPKFLRYLYDNITVEFGRSRMVFTADEINNKDLETVKKESHSMLYKEIQTHCIEFFEQNPSKTEFLASLTDLKTQWFEKDSRIGMNYIKKVLNDEFKIFVEKNTRYMPFATTSYDHSRTGTPYRFLRENFVNSQTVERQNSSLTAFFEENQEPNF